MGFKEQFQLSMFGFSNVERQKFFFPLTDCCHDNTLIIVRGIFAFYTLISCVTDLIRQSIIEKSGRWFIYFTSWNYVLVVAYFVTAFVQSLRYHKNYRSDAVTVGDISLANLESSFKEEPTVAKDTELNSTDRFMWILYNAALTICPFVVFGYWVLVFDPEVTPLRANAETFFSIDRHGIILALLIIEYMFQRNPFRILHFYHPVFVWILYVIFNVIYWSITGDGVYSLVDWGGNPGQTILGAVIVMVVLIVYHFIFFFVDSLKKKLAGPRGILA